MSARRQLGVLLLALPMLSCTHVGQRLLTVIIEVDGAAVLEGHTAVPDFTPVDQMWPALAEAQFEPVAGAGEPSMPLTGEVTVRIQHTSTVLATATLETLTLTKDPSSNTWSLSGSQVTRIEQVATP
ncbi:hypothetical protein NG895_24100 [Aeoliella sp. ICT_H6.2]|uniref:Uncharacterized protein n=1 Tax=Aeoliella straminimaris TaxID=2954799 RepID=A0A9X2JJP8_9BACT|nr:hypothetical protein [Aeoliella straminimaris]MCO6046993.1 hypothetical protein [Aeoliella straminimaris]